MNNSTDAEGSQEATEANEIAAGPTTPTDTQQPTDQGDAEKPLIERTSGPLSGWVWPGSGRVDVFRDQLRDDWERPLTPDEAETFGRHLYVLAAGARADVLRPTRSETPSRRPSWLTTACPPWCEAGDEHSDRDHYDDRTHFGPSREVVLTAVDDRHTGSDDEPAVARTYLSQHYREIGPRISLHRDDTPVDITFTVDEAEEFALKLLDLVAEARRGK